jgi:hypothetical protein
MRFGVNNAKKNKNGYRQFYFNLGYDDGNPTPMTVCGSQSPKVAGIGEQEFSVKRRQS